MKGIQFYPLAPGENPVHSSDKGWFPRSLHLGELERAMQEAFATRGKRVIDDYFNPEGELRPRDISFVIIGRNDMDKNGLVSGMVATNETVDGLEFLCYDKIFVIPQYEDQGVMAGMVGLARTLGDPARARPAVLKTSYSKAHEKYRGLSDIKFAAGEYSMHGFGFLDPTTNVELFEGAREKFMRAARHVASKPPVLVPLQSPLPSGEYTAQLPAANQYRSAVPTYA